MTGSDRPVSRRERGVALLAVLWVVALLSVIAATSLRGTRADANLASNLVGALRAQALADGGVHAAVVGLLAPPPAA